MTHDQWLYDIPAHSLGTVLLLGLHRSEVDRAHIEELLTFIENEYPEIKSEIINQAFCHVLEDCYQYRDTWIVERFIAAGANLDQAFCLRKPVWQAGCTGQVAKWEQRRPQVVAVLRVLINAGADPDKRWESEPDYEGGSASEFFADLSSKKEREGRWHAMDPLAALEEAEQWKELDAGTAMATGSARVGRL